eukprot:212603_1
MAGYEDFGDAPGENRTGFMNKSFKICRLFGIEIRIHVLLPLFLIATLFIWLPLIAQDTKNTGWYILLILLFNISLWETVLIHELGHALSGYLVGGHTDKILLWPLGGLAFTQPPITNDNAQTRRNSIIIALGGPLTHIPHCILYAVLLLWYCSTSTPYFPTTCPYGTLDGKNPFESWKFWQQIIVINCDGNGGLCFWYDFLMLSFMINFWLFIINLFVPAFPLDGSKIFINCLLNKYNVDKAAKIYCWIAGIIAAISLIIAVALFRSNTMLFFVGIWAAFQVYQMVMYLRAGSASNHPLFR